MREGIIGGSYPVPTDTLLFFMGSAVGHAVGTVCVGRLGGLGSSGGKGGGGYGDGKGGGGKQKSVLTCFVKRTVLMLEPNMGYPMR